MLVDALTEKHMYMKAPKGHYSSVFFDIFFERYPDHEKRDSFPMKNVFEVVNSLEFLQKVPRYVNQRETWANIQLVNAGLILYR